MYIMILLFGFYVLLEILHRPNNATVSFHLFHAVILHVSSISHATVSGLLKTW